MLTTVVLFLVVIINDAALNPGKTLTLNTCGKYDEYQKWKYNNGLISLSSSSNLCLECSGAGYCSHGQKPIVAGYCDNSDYRENFKFIPVSGKSSVNIQVNGLCLQPLGAEEYASIQILDCNTGYNNDDLQQFIYDSSSLYMKSAMNDSLCVTAMYYPISNCSEAPLSSLPYCDATKDIDTRVQDLVSRMTIYEKIDNLAGSNIGVPRLGVPPNKVLECLHGVFSGCGATYNGNTGCPTSFPNALLLGATFNRSLWNQIGITISDEGRALDNQNIGGLYCFSPNINLFRDPRW